MFVCLFKEEKARQTIKTVITLPVIVVENWLNCSIHFFIIHMQMQTTLKVYLALAGVVTASSTRVVPPSTAIKDTLSKRTVSRPIPNAFFFCRSCHK